MKTDLNLLRVFDVLMEQRSVSRAADRLGLTQSAVSHALARLRTQLDDPLFVRAQGGLRPTPRARQMAPSIRDGLSLLRDAFSVAAFEPASTARVFTISASSYYCVTLIPAVIQQARADAPLARFRIAAPSPDLFAELDDGVLDLALGSFGRCPARFARSVLFLERLVWIGRRHGDRDDPGELSTRPRLAMVRGPQPATPEEIPLGVAPGAPFPPGPSTVIIHDPLSAGAFIADSDLVTLLPYQLARIMTAHVGVDILGDGEPRDIEMTMLWHSRMTADPAHVWLRRLIEAAAAKLR